MVDIISLGRVVAVIAVRPEEDIMVDTMPCAMLNSAIISSIP